MEKNERLWNRHLNVLFFVLGILIMEIATSFCASMILNIIKTIYL